MSKDRYRQLEPGDAINVTVYGYHQPATVLACIGAEAMIEYVLESGRSALWIIPRNYRLDRLDAKPWAEAPYRNVNYRKIPKRWLVQIVRNDAAWWASPMRAPDLHMTPRALFLSRWPDEAWRLTQEEQGSFTADAVIVKPKEASGFTADAMTTKPTAPTGLTPDAETKRTGPSPAQMTQTARTNATVRARITRR